MNAIKELRRAAGMSQAELAGLCGVHQTAVSQWENGRTSPDKKTLRTLAGLFHVSIDALLGGERTPDHVKQIPVLGYVRAGVPVEALENVLGYEEFSGELSGDYFGLRVRGDSMEPAICDGDTVIVKKQSTIESGEIAVVLVNYMDATIKTVIKKGTGIELVPINSFYKTLSFSAEEISRLPVTIIGKVEELRRKY